MELIVVLVVLGLSVALVAPALIFPEPRQPGGYGTILNGAVELAAAREEVLSLVVDPEGRWHLAATTLPEALADGRIDGYDGPAFTLQVSPLGTCGPQAGSALPFDLDPLTCAPATPTDPNDAIGSGRGARSGSPAPAAPTGGGS